MLSRLSAKVLLLAVGFVLLAELLLFIPSLAQYRETWLTDRAVQAGHLTLALTGVTDYEGSEILSERFMQDTDVILLATKRAGMTELILGEPPTAGPFETVDLRVKRNVPDILTTFRDFFGSDQGYLRVLSEPLLDGQERLEYIVPRSALKQALTEFCHRILLLSLFIALFTGILLYAALSIMIVRPVKTLADGLAVFRENPERKRSNLPPSGRKDEIGQLQREFFDLKQSVRASLKQKERLSALGLAVAKINHDLRNVLTTAQLVSDRIAMDKDARVARMGERLMKTVDRGVKLCADVLRYSKPGEETATFETVTLSAIAAEAVEDALSLAHPDTPVIFTNTLPDDMQLRADPDHTYRIINNLARNAVQAMTSLTDDRPKHILIEPAENHAIRISDTGPGLPDKVRDNLFTAFLSSTSHGSTGLGLTIARELARGQGGDLSLSQTGPDGTVFTLSFARD